MNKTLETAIALQGGGALGAYAVGDWDSGVFDNTLLSTLFDIVEESKAANTQIVMANLFPSTGHLPHDLLEVNLRQEEIHFSNKTKRDIELARTINSLSKVFQKLSEQYPEAVAAAKLEVKTPNTDKYKAFDRIIEITNGGIVRSLGGIDFSSASMAARMQAGFHDTILALSAPDKAVRANR